MEYTSKSQKARIFTESWIAENGYCLACDSDRLISTSPNTKARDFECVTCGHPYELKSALRPFGSRVVDGAFVSMMGRINAGTLPTFLLMRYSAALAITDLSAIHRVLITPDLIEKRKPLSPTARRAGWVGCNLLLRGVPPEGRVSLMTSGALEDRTYCRNIFKKTAALATQDFRSRSWSRAVLFCLHRLPSAKFTLKDVYAFEFELSQLFPNNHHIRPKIRQQLQILRDAGLVIFEQPGYYRLTFKNVLEKS